MQQSASKILSNIVKYEMNKVHRLSERSTGFNAGKREDNKTYIMNNFSFNIVNKKESLRQKLFREQGYDYLTDKYKCCTYIHYYDNEQYPFYIGSGTMLRAFSFNSNERNIHWNDKVKDVNKLRVVIYKFNISKKKAREYEEELINKYSKYNCLCNIKNTNVKYADYKINHTVDKRNWACFDLKGNHIKTFETLKDAAEEYLTYESTIKRCAKEDKIFRGIIKWVKI